jgi:hypothetical protein
MIFSLYFQECLFDRMFTKYDSTILCHTVIVLQKLITAAIYYIIIIVTGIIIAHAAPNLYNDYVFNNFTPISFNCMDIPSYTGVDKGYQEC